MGCLLGFFYPFRLLMPSLQFLASRFNAEAPNHQQTGYPTEVSYWHTVVLKKNWRTTRPLGRVLFPSWVVERCLKASYLVTLSQEMSNQGH